MNIKITRPDGTVIEAEGTLEECQALALAMSPPPRTLSLKSAPAQLPLPLSPPPIPWGPSPWDVYPYPPIMPQYPPATPIYPDITWWMSNTAGDTLRLAPTSEFQVGDQLLPITTGSYILSAGWQGTPTGANLC